MRQVSPCPVCRCDWGRILENAAPPHRVVRCPGCGLVYVDPVPAPAVLQYHYGKAYYAEWISSQKNGRERMWAQRMNLIERISAGPGRLLDVGCGDGAFLDHAIRRGWAVDGTEVSTWAADHASRRLGRAIFHGEIWDTGFPAQRYDVVTLWHVLEHVWAPLRVLEEARRVMKPSGRLVVAVPNVDDRIMQTAYRIVRRRRPRLFSLEDKELHLFHFSVPSLRRLLGRSGFTSIEAGPDFGIVERSKRVLNTAAVAVSRCFNRHWYNSILMIAKPA
ncbi:MAG: class I SAM-dependent methyltransferase [Desulfobacterales bacterium]